MIEKTHTKRLIVLFTVVIAMLLLYFSYLSQNADKQFPPPVTDTSLSQPVIGLETILTVADVQQALILSAQDGDIERLEQWQAKIINVAEEAGYRPEDIAFLMGEQGIDYLQFRGNRFWFQQEVERAYQRGESVEDVFARFPQANDLFAQTEQLFVQRDQIIQSIALTLLEAAASQDSNDLSAEQAQAAAIKIWRQRNNGED